MRCKERKRERILGKKRKRGCGVSKIKGKVGRESKTRKKEGEMREKGEEKGDKIKISEQINAAIELAKKDKNEKEYKLSTLHTNNAYLYKRQYCSVV